MRRKGRDMNSTKRLTLTAMLTAVALVLGWLEHIVPVTGNLPYIKLGISNIAVVFAVYMLGPGCACALVAAKVTLSAILFGGFSGFLYSAAGGAVSLAVMLLVRRMKNVTPVGVSAAGGAFHMAAQTAVAALLTSTGRILWLLAPLTAVGTLTGAVTGVACSLVLRGAAKLGGKGIYGDGENTAGHEYR